MGLWGKIRVMEWALHSGVEVRLQGWSGTIGKVLRYGETVGQETGSWMVETALRRRVLFMRRQCRYGVRGGYGVGGGCGLPGSGLAVGVGLCGQCWTLGWVWGMEWKWHNGMAQRDGCLGRRWEWGYGIEVAQA